MGNIICELPKSTREKLVFKLNDFRGRHYLDMRVYLVGENGSPEAIGPAADSPNPGQAWGLCGKRSEGRYGVAMACEALLNEGGCDGYSNSDQKH